MNRRFRGDESRDASAHLQPVVDDDAFLDALSRGEDPSGGQDELASLLLELRDDIERPMPEAPLVASDAPTGEMPAVASLDKARTRSRSRRRVSPWASGLIGAAAATVAVVGTGAALYGATPGSPLWGPSTAVFGDRESVVELASTLDNLEAANASGDEAKARQLLEQARLLVGSMQKEQPQGGTQTETSVSTTSVTVPGPSESKTKEKPSGTTSPSSSTSRKPTTSREQSTTTATVTDVVTVTVTRGPNPQPGAPGGAAPTKAPTAEPSTQPTASQPTSAPTSEPQQVTTPSASGNATSQAQVNSSHG